MAAFDATMKLQHRNRWITLFVIGWLLLFHYESLRYSYLRPLVHQELPKVPLLFPPAGWIMFYRVDASAGHAEVYGVRDGVPELLDPHRILATRFVWYDNICRNVLVCALEQPLGPSFCRFLRRKFPAYPEFAIVYVQYSSVVERPQRAQRYGVYRCAE